MLTPVEDTDEDDDEEDDDYDEDDDERPSHRRLLRGKLSRFSENLFITEIPNDNVNNINIEKSTVMDVDFNGEEGSANNNNNEKQSNLFFIII
jgi:hypothetical protein